MTVHKEESSDETMASPEIDDDEVTAMVIDREKRNYPYAAMLFVLMASVGLGFTTGGMITTVEFYFTHFLYVCFGDITTGLSTASVNLFLTLGLLSAVYSGFQADRLLGSFVTHNMNYIISVTGSFLFVLSTWLYTLSPPTCCHRHTNSTSDIFTYDKMCEEVEFSILTRTTGINIPPMLTMTLVLLGLGMFAVGNGQLWLLNVFIGEQFDERDSKQAQEQQRAFAWFYFWMTFGMLAGELGLPVMRQSTGYVISYITVAAAAFLTMVVFMAGGRFYVKKPPQRKSCKLHCYHKKRPTICEEVAKLADTESNQADIDESNESNSDSTQPTSDASRKSCIESNTETETDDQTQEITSSDQDTPMLITKKENSKLKHLVPLLKIFVPQIIFWAVFYQRSSTFILQGAQMDCFISSLHIPPDVMPSTEDVMVLLLVPAFEYILYPHLRRSMGIQVKPMHKLICGMVALTLGLVLAGLLQIYVSEPSSECHGDVSITWQLPQLFLVSIADVLVGITGLEVAYLLAPPDFRNIVTALSLITQALGTLLNALMAMIPMSLLATFFVYASMMTITTIIFILISRNITINNENDDKSSATAT